MGKIRYISILVLIIFSGCKGSNYSIVKNECKFNAKPVETEYNINNSLIEERSRGGIDAVGLATQAVTLAIDGIQKVIAAEQKKYVSEYGKKVSNLYFYDQTSDLGMYDPTGLLFDGVRIHNTFKPEDTNTFETALMLDFELVKDSSWTLSDMVTSGIFYLKLKDCDIKYTRAKMAKTRWYNPITWGSKKNDERLNIDVELKLKSTYIAEGGEMVRDELIGSFLFPIRNCPMNPDQEDYETFREDLIGKRMQGFSFLVPRSAAYAIDDRTKAFKKIYGLGRFSLEINVKESGKDKLIERTFYEQAPELFKSLNKSAQKELPKLFENKRN
jgi:hypothetical protein